MASRSGLEDLELTGDEVGRLAKAFQDEGFRTLFAEYAAELADPEQRAIYEAEVAALERQRGVEARFIHPAPGWVLRTSQAGTRRCYLNICSNPLVGRPEARPEPGGSCWSLPHCLAPGREELSRRPRGPRRLVYDVVFHPDTLHLAARSARFRRLVDDTALEAVEKHYAPGLDRANAVPLRGTKYKGVPQATLLRTPLPGGAPPPETGEGGSPLPPFPSPYTYPPAKPEREAQPSARPAPPPAAATTPRWTLRHRSYVDLQDYRNSRYSAPSPVPRELVVTIELPLLSSAAQAQLEIRGQELQLDSQRPAAYRLRLPLPYAVVEDSGRATFNKAKKQLVVILPVLPKPASGAISNGQASQEQNEAPEEEEGEPEPLRVDSGSIPPRERQGNAAAAAPANASSGLCLEPSRVQQAPPISHEDANSASLPACAAEIPPAAAMGAASTCPTTISSAVPLCSDASSPAPLGPHVPTSCNSSELPACAGETDPAASWAASFSPLPAVCNGNISPEVPTCSSSDVDLCVVRDDTGSVSPVEFPVHSSSIPGPVTPVRPVDLCTSMDLNQCTSIINLMSPSCTSEDNLDRSLTALPCHDCSKVDQRPAFSASTDLPVPASHVELPVPALSPGNRTSTSPVASTPGPSTDTDTPMNATSCLDSSVSPASSTHLPCPPFHCTQDEKALTLLLQVPGIVPQSLKGDVGTNHYRISFSDKASEAYSCYFQFLPENKLTPPEISINVSPNNAVITLAKSPKTTRVWTKLYFGPNVDALQERWFVTENNVDTFLSSLLRTSCSSQSEIEHQTLLEVLAVSEGRSQIRLKAPEQNSCEHGKTEGRVDPRRGGGEQENSDELSTGPESCSVQIERVSGSLTATETMGRVGKGSGHCSLLDPGDPGLAIPEKLQISERRESELAFTTGKRATSTLQGQLNWEKPAQTGEKEDVHSEPAQNKCGLESRPVSAPAPPVLKETNMEDGSVQYITHHTTHCAVTFQNALLYELD